MRLSVLLLLLLLYERWNAEISAGDLLTKHCSLLTRSVESDGGVIDVKAMTPNVLT